MLTVDLPYGVRSHKKAGVQFYDCRPPACEDTDGFETWHVLLLFSGGGPAYATFFIRASDFGAISNGVAASAALPSVAYDGPRSSLLAPPQLLAAYHIPSASNFNWTGYRTYQSTSTVAVWKEQLVNGLTAEKTTSGTNALAQAASAFRLFLAGILFGTAGAALVAAAQEALHARTARRGGEQAPRY
jgi:hypothetical protein